MTRADLWIGLLGIVAFALLYLEARNFPYGSEFAPGPGFAPVWLSLLGLLLSALVAINGLRARGSPAAPPDPSGRTGLVRVAAAVIGMVVLLQLVRPLGLILAVLVYLLFLTLVVQRLRWPVALSTSLGTMLFIYVVFQRFLNVPMPRGPLGI